MSSRKRDTEIVAVTVLLAVVFVSVMILITFHHYIANQRLEAELMSLSTCITDSECDEWWLHPPKLSH